MGSTLQNVVEQLDAVKGRADFGPGERVTLAALKDATSEGRWRRVYTDELYLLVTAQKHEDLVRQGFDPDHQRDGVTRPTIEGDTLTYWKHNPETNDHAWIGEVLE